MDNLETQRRSTAAILFDALCGRCPRCGKGRLFAGYLRIAPACKACGVGFAGHDSGDGPAVFVIFLLGIVVVGLAALMERFLAPPLWLHALVWIPVTLVGTVALLRPLKGLLIGFQFRYRSLDEPAKPGGA